MMFNTHLKSLGPLEPSCHTRLYCLQAAAMQLGNTMALLMALTMGPWVAKWRSAVCLQKTTKIERWLPKPNMMFNVSKENGQPPDGSVSWWGHTTRACPPHCQPLWSSDPAPGGRWSRPSGHPPPASPRSAAPSGSSADLSWSNRCEVRKMRCFV